MQASLVCDTSSLDPLLSEYGALMRSATDLIDHYVGLKRRNRDIKPIKVCSRCEMGSIHCPSVAMQGWHKIAPFCSIASHS